MFLTLKNIHWINMINRFSYKGNKDIRVQCCILDLFYIWFILYILMCCNNTICALLMRCFLFHVWRMHRIFHQFKSLCHASKLKWIRTQTFWIQHGSIWNRNKHVIEFQEKFATSWLIIKPSVDVTFKSYYHILSKKVDYFFVTLHVLASLSNIQLSFLYMIDL